jgi:hypothetical protein
MASRWSPGYSCPITLQLVGPHSWTEVPARLGYDPTDPFAVRIAFGEPGENALNGSDGIAWLVSRELLRAGLNRPSGEGDVRIWPTRSSGDALFLHLRAPSGEALFEMSRAAVAAFLRHTEALVPTGAEEAMLGLDEELQALLSNGGWDSSR